MANLNMHNPGWWERWRRRVSLAQVKREGMKFDGPLQLAEAEALVRFVAERKIEGTTDLVDNLNAVIVDIKEQGSVTAGKSSEWKALVTHYKALADITDERLGVNGRRILESRDQPYVRVISVYILVFLVIAVLPAFRDTVMLYISEDDDPLLFVFFDQIASQMAPFFWGGIGACLYLLKTLSDRAANSQYDSRKLQGVFPRIILGSVLAVVVVSVFGLEVSIGEQTIAGTKVGIAEPKLSPAAMAFLAGLGQKAFFDVFESLVKTVSGFAKKRGP